MPKLIVMVGLPGSGKSYYVNNILDLDRKVVLSSDAIRKELLGDESDQSNNELVFNTLYKRGREHLKNGDNVVIDATNINCKDRRRVLSNFQGIDAKRIAIVMATPIGTCNMRDYQRDRNVGTDVINKFVKRFEVPMEYEGFDEIKIERHNSCYSIKLLDDKMYGFNQQNPHHKYTLSVHCELCKSWVGQILFDKHLARHFPLILAAQWHDVGKLFTQEFDENGIAHYYGHHNVGAYVFMCSDLQYLAREHHSCWDEKFREIVFYINFHMLPFLWNNENAKEKARKLWGDELFNNIMILHEADKIASGTYKN